MASTTMPIYTSQWLFPVIRMFLCNGLEVV
jgi:hypothetical protein